MSNTVDDTKPVSETREMHGRRVITVSVDEITEDNLISVLDKALATHELNRSEIDYLYNYYKGNQPILRRKKKVRKNICNRIVENRANEIVSFKVGYLCGEPIQYVGRSGDEQTTEAVMRLNELMYAEDKASQDEEIAEWFTICGTAYRMVLPDNEVEQDDAPFEMYTLDPRDSFVVYSSSIGGKRLMGVKYYTDDNNQTHYSIYTPNMFWVVDGRTINRELSRPHALGDVPIYEYPANNARLGSFEIVLPLLDAINKIDSNRADGIEQFIQAFMKFTNCEMDEELYQKFLELGAIMVNSKDGQKSDVDIVSAELSQSETQTLKDDMYSAVLQICGMPNRNGGSSTSDTGSAVLLRDGWSDAEARAKDTEHIFKRSEKKMLKLLLKICAEAIELDLKVKDIDLQFTRRNYDNIQSKSQVLVTMLQQEKIHPLLAFQHSGLFIDPERAYKLSMEYYEEQKAKAEQTGLITAPIEGAE